MILTQERTVRRVPHPLVYRTLYVQHVQSITPRMLRLTIGGDELAGFHSPSFDDHIKLFFPEPGGSRDLILPTAGPDGPIPPLHGPASPCRSYTPSRVDLAAGELAIDVVLHAHGPAATWAEQAVPGDVVGIGGPRRSFVVPEDTSWHLLVGDETAIPAIARRLAELPSNAKAVVAIEIDDPADEQLLPSRADVRLTWLYRGATPARESSALEKLVRELDIPAESRYLWGAGESLVMRSLRNHLLRERGIRSNELRVTGYWTQGIPNHVE